MTATQDRPWPIPADAPPEQDEDDAGWPVPVDAFQVLPTDYAELPPIIARNDRQRRS